MSSGGLHPPVDRHAPIGSRFHIHSMAPVFPVDRQNFHSINDSLPFSSLKQTIITEQTKKQFISAQFLFVSFFRLFLSFQVHSPFFPFVIVTWEFKKKKKKWPHLGAKLCNLFEFGVSSGQYFADRRPLLRCRSEAATHQLVHLPFSFFKLKIWIFLTFQFNGILNNSTT